MMKRRTSSLRATATRALGGAAMDQGAIETVKVAVRAGGEGGGWPRTQRSSALPCLVIGPRWHMSAEALTAGAKPT